MKQVTVRLSSLGDQSIEVPGLGVFDNNTTTDIEDERVAVFEAHGGTWPEEDELIFSDNVWPSVMPQPEPDPDAVVEVPGDVPPMSVPPVVADPVPTAGEEVVNG